MKGWESAPRWKRKQQIELPVPPQANNRLVIGKNKKTGKVHLFTAPEVRQYKKGIAQLLLFLKPVPAPRDVRLDIVWHMEMGDRGDLDNRLKIALDVLSGHAYDDDKQVAELHVYRAKNQRRAKMVVTVEDMTPEEQNKQERRAAG